MSVKLPFQLNYPQMSKHLQHLQTGQQPGPTFTINLLCWHWGPVLRSRFCCSCETYQNCLCCLLMEFISVWTEKELFKSYDKFELYILLTNVFWLIIKFQVFVNAWSRFVWNFNIFRFIGDHCRIRAINFPSTSM